MSEGQSTKRKIVNDTFIVIYFRFEQCQHTGYLVCKDADLSDEERRLVISLEKYGAYGNIYDQLVEQKILSTDILYGKGEDEQEYKFYHVDSLIQPPGLISTVVHSWC